MNTVLIKFSEALIAGRSEIVNTWKR
jgi:hypothetical protein